MPAPKVKWQHNIITSVYTDSTQSEAGFAATGILMPFTTVEKNPNKNFISKGL